MNVRKFMDVVPKPVKTGAVTILCLGVLISVAAVVTRGSLAGLGFGLLAGIFGAAWVLCLGYVYADARRRAMRPILWTLIVAFMPNLLGFLLYFALRRPIALPCTQCGMATTPEQRFCPSCGYQGSSALSTQPA